MHSLFILGALISTNIAELFPREQEGIEKELEKNNQKNSSSDGLIPTSTEALSIPILKELTVYAATSFCNDGVIKSWSCKQCKKVSPATLQEVYEDPKMATKYYTATVDKEKRIILSFRGTENQINEDSNTDIKLVPFPAVSDPEVKVHSGFLRGEEALEASFLNSIDKLFNQPKYNNYTLTVVGHSLGGALACLAASKISTMKAQHPFEMDLITYGQPKTGNVAFVNWLNKQPFSKSRVVNEDDNVPHYEALDQAGYAHSQNEIWIHNNDIKTCSNEKLEDPTCSASVPQKDLKTQDHLDYFGTRLGLGTC